MKKYSLNIAYAGIHWAKIDFGEVPLKQAQEKARRVRLAFERSSARPEEWEFDLTCWETRTQVVSID